MTRILGLDPGETTGWAVYERVAGGEGVTGFERVIAHGVIAVDNAEQASEAMILTTTRSYVRALLQRYMLEGLAVVAIEAPAYSRKFNRFADEIRGVCKEAVASVGLSWCLVAQNTAKKATGVKTGRKKGDPPPARSAKDAVKAVVEARFNLVGLSYHEADAVACAVALAKERER